MHPALLWFNVVQAVWLIRTDKSERPDVGKSTLRLHVEQTVVAEGDLFALQGETGPVGFARIETAVPVDASRYREVCFDFSGGPAGARYSVLIKDDQTEQAEGILVFETEIAPRACVPFSSFVGTIRGKPYPEFSLNRGAIEAFAIQISRSQQKELLDVAPLEFRFSLSGAVTLR